MAVHEHSWQYVELIRQRDINLKVTSKARFICHCGVYKLVEIKKENGN